MANLKFFSQEEARIPTPAVSGDGTLTGLTVEGSFHLPFNTDLQSILGKEELRPVSRSSRPIFELLTGNENWHSIWQSVLTDHTTADDCDSSGRYFGLIAPDLEKLGEAFVIRRPTLNRVVPAVWLRGGLKRWRATPCVLKNDDLGSKILMIFQSASVAALLTMTEAAFRSLLSDGSKAASRFEYLRDTGELFVPVPPDKDNWEIGCTWPDWQRRRRDYIERTLEWAKDHRIPVSTAKEVDRLAAYLRQRWGRMGLRISDTSDA